MMFLISILVLTLALIPSFLGAQLPPSLTPPIPITATAYGGAPDAQMAPMIAVSDNGALIVWRDSRRGAYSVVAARIAADGSVLDTVGLLIADAAFPEAVVADAGVFRILLSTNGARRIITIEKNGTISSDRTLDPSLSKGQYAASRSGQSARFLFLSPDDSGTAATIIDGEGDLVARQVLFSAVTNQYVIGASRGSEFLLLLPFTSVSASDYLALRVGADARLISATLANVGGYSSSALLAGGGEDGYLLVKQPDYVHPNTTTTYKLDANGAFTGVAPGLEGNARHVEWAGDRYVLTYITGGQPGHALTGIAELTTDTWQTGTVADWVGIASDAVNARIEARTLIVTAVNLLFTSSSYDLYVQTWSGAAPAGPRLVSGSATLQTSAEIAAGKNGYLVSWSENGPDRFVRTYIRRFSAAGVPQGDAISIREDEQSFNYTTASSDVRIASNDDTYVIVYRWNGYVSARRMNAASGEWLDREPVRIGPGAVAEVASNGRDAVIVYWDDGLTARRIALAGDPALSPPVKLGSTRNAYNPAVASNGDDYLVAWSDGFRFCPFECSYDPFKLLAVRLRGDATRIDVTPLVIDDRGYPDFPAIEFAGGHYLFAWLNGALRGARLTPEGVITETDVLEQSSDWSSAPILLRLNKQFVLFTKHTYRDGIFTDQNWTATAFDASLPLDQVAALPRTIVTSGPGERYLTLSASSRDGILGTAYDEPADATKGYVNRVFLRFFGDLSKRRSAGH